MTTATQMTAGQAVQVGRRNFVIEEIKPIDAATFPHVYDILTGNGWEPNYYLLVGKRGAHVLAYRNARWGTLVYICKI